MRGESDLGNLLAGMSPVVKPGRFVFATVAHDSTAPQGLASVVEPEGRSVVLSQQDADRLGLEYDFVAGWITLQVHSALSAIGLTATLSSALAAAGISSNVVAGHYHDHLLVPYERRDEAVNVLRGLAGTPG